MLGDDDITDESLVKVAFRTTGPMFCSSCAKRGKGNNNDITLKRTDTSNNFIV